MTRTKSAAWPRVVAAVAFAAIAVVLVWLLRPSGDVPNAPIVAPAPTITTLPAPTATSLERSPPSARENDANVARPVPEHARRFPLRVIDAVSRLPVPGATVWWYDATCDGEHVTGEFVEDVVKRCGWQTTTNDVGVAELAWSRGWISIAAAHGGRYGRLDLRAEEVRASNGETVEIVADRTLRVRVVDDRGSPAANVEVGFGSCDAGGALTLAARSATTDERGVATIVHLQDAIAGYRSSWHRHQPAWSGPLAVNALVPGNREPAVVVDESASASRDEVDLRIPACGSVVVRLAGFDAVTDPTHVRLHDADKGQYTDVNANIASVEADGTARFARVALGCRFATTCDGWVATKFGGPNRPGEELVVEMQRSDTLLRVTGRLLFALGVPVVSQQIAFAWIRDWTTNTGKVRTDANGRFALAFDPGSGNVVLRLECASPDGRPLRAEFRPVLRAATAELGDVVFATAPLLCSGRMVTRGAPCTEELDLWVETFDPSANAWKSKERCERRFGGGGTFTVVADEAIRAVRHRLVFREGLLREPLEFDPGTTDLVVEIDPGSTITASLRLPTRADWYSIGVRLVPDPPLVESAEERERHRYDGALYATRGQSPDRRIACWEHLAPGSYTFEARLLATGATIVRIPDIRTPTTVTDARLVDIDLRSVLRIVQPKFVGSNGEAVTGVILVSTNPAGERTGTVVTREGVLLPTTPMELLALDRQHRPTVVHFDGERCEGRLEPWPTIVVTLANGAALPPDTEVRLTVTAIDPVEIAYREIDSSNPKYRPFAPYDTVYTLNGPTSVPIGDGRYRLEVDLHRRGGRYHRLDGIVPAEITASAGPLTITAPEKAWADAAAAMR